MQRSVLLYYNKLCIIIVIDWLTLIIRYIVSLESIYIHLTSRLNPTEIDEAEECLAASKSSLLEKVGMETTLYLVLVWYLDRERTSSQPRKWKVGN